MLSCHLINYIRHIFKSFCLYDALSSNNLHGTPKFDQWNLSVTKHDIMTLKCKFVSLFIIFCNLFSYKKVGYVPNKLVLSENQYLSSFPKNNFNLLKLLDV